MVSWLKRRPSKTKQIKKTLSFLACFLSVHAPIWLFLTFMSRWSLLWLLSTSVFVFVFCLCFLLLILFLLLLFFLWVSRVIFSCFLHGRRFVGCFIVFFFFFFKKKD